MVKVVVGNIVSKLFRVLMVVASGKCSGGEVQRGIYCTRISSRKYLHVFITLKWHTKLQTYICIYQQQATGL